MRGIAEHLFQRPSACNLQSPPVLYSRYISSLNTVRSLPTNQKLRATDRRLSRPNFEAASHPPSTFQNGHRQNFVRQKSRLREPIFAFKMAKNSCVYPMRPVFGDLPQRRRQS